MPTTQNEAESKHQDVTFSSVLYQFYGAVCQAMSQGEQTKFDREFDLLEESNFDLVEAENEFDQGIEIAPGVEYGGTKQLAQEKISARMRLLSIPPETAQQLVDMTLYPQYWSLRPENLKWEESIPTSYGDNDDAEETNS